jgi:hypothetical protein
MPLFNSSSPFVNMVSSVAPTAVDGNIWNDSTRKALVSYVNGVNQTISTVLFVQTADQTVTNTVSETTILGSGVGSLTLPANFLVAGKMLRVRIAGIYSTPSLVTPSILVKIKFGSTVLASVTTTSLLSGASSLRFSGEALITCRTIGSSGSVMVHGEIGYSTGVLGTIALDALNNNGVAVTVNTTSSNTLDVSVTWDAATTTRIAKSIVTVFEALN